MVLRPPAYRKLPTSLQFTFSLSLSLLSTYSSPLPSVTPPPRSPFERWLVRSRVPHSSDSLALSPVAPLWLPRLRSGLSQALAFLNDTGPLVHCESVIPLTCIIHSLILRPDSARHDLLAGVPSNSCLALRCHGKQCGVVTFDHNSHSVLWTWGISHVEKDTIYRHLEPNRVRCTGPGRQTPRQDDLLIVLLDRIP